MDAIMHYAVPASVLVVFCVLVAGLWNMWKGANPSFSQTLMRWRVGLQFLAICIAMLAIYLKRGI
jgi:hypothetical protein